MGLDIISDMTKDAFLRQVESLSDEQFAKVSAFLEADLEALEVLDALRDEVAEGRRSAAEQPLLDAKDVYHNARRKLSS